MAVTDLWHLLDGQRCPQCRTKAGTPSKRHGRGMRWRTTVTGHPTRSFDTKAAAEAWEAELRTRGVRPGGNATVGKLVDLWLEGKAYLPRASLRPLEVAARRVHIRWGGVDVGEVTTHDIQAWVAGLTSGDDQRPAAASTKAKTLSALRGAMTIATTAGMIDADPCAGVKVGRLRRIDPRFLNVAQLRAVAAAAGDYGPLVWLLGTAGLRISEAQRLDVGDVDVDRQRLRVRVAKSGRGRDVPVPQRVLDMLPVAERAVDDPLFLSPQGRRLDAHNFRHRVWPTAAAAAKVGALRIHDLRHTAASLMIASGATVKDVQAALGHSSAAMTLDLYGHRFEGHLADVARRMNEALGVPDS